MCGTEFGKTEETVNKGHDGMMVGCSYKSGVGVHGMHDLDTGKTHNTRNVRWMGKMFKDHVKEDAVSEKESSKSDSTKNKKKDDNEEETEEVTMKKRQKKNHWVEWQK